MKKIVPTDAVLIPAQAVKVFSGIIFDVYQWEQPLFDGSTTTFEMLRRIDTVKAICVVDGHILVLAEDQPNAPARGYEFPGGRVEKSATTYLDEIKREVQEETGYRFREWRLVLVSQVNQHIEGFFYYYLATDVFDRQPPAAEAGEHIELKQLTFPQVQELSKLPEHGLWHVGPLLQQANSIQDLSGLPSYKGQEVDR